jgi:CRISPR-associated endonuclease/helicase Cas3
VDSTSLFDDPKEAHFAHTPNKQGVWHSLVQHLNTVAALTEKFAGAFGESELGYLIGLLHDIGKFNPDFQEYLVAQSQDQYHVRVPHAWGGAALTYIRKEQLPWKEICLPIAGHHSGLEEPGVLSSRLVSLINKNHDLMRTFQGKLASVVPENRRRLSIPLRTIDNRLKQEFRIRMLFSALVDADRLDTERHFEEKKSDLRTTWTTSMHLLWQRFKDNQDKLLASADGSKSVNQVRYEVYQACLDAAERPQGLFRLTVPTGGGKTRSALAFGLRHALRHGLRRIVVALPYTSIIDQTAKVYREILGENVVLEHHSQVNLSETSPGGQSGSSALRYELATENWDVPVIVTTTVQLFESLFSNHPSRCRKIHNIAKSVVILDEVQSLPTEILKPTLDAIRRLIEDYRVSVVLCTATQPALQSAPFLDELSDLEAKEIVPDYTRHFELLKRVDYEIRNVEQSLDSIAEEIATQPQCLVILNTRKEALELFSLMSEKRTREEVYHLSTFLCGAHRRVLIADITRRLRQKEPVCVVSTQVVEAGIDFDFPVVYRALGPLDRIVQAAGRCNREGKKKLGRVVVFRPEGSKSPRGPYAAGLEKARLLLERYPPERLHDPDLYEEYFQDLYYDLELDKYNLQEFRRDLNYPAVAERYWLISGNTVCVVVPYGDAFTLLERWLAYPSRESWRTLQPYLINLFDHEALRLERDGWLVRIADGLYRWEGGYDNRRGIVEALYDPADLVS